MRERKSKRPWAVTYNFIDHPFVDGNPQKEEIDPMQPGFWVNRTKTTQKATLGTEAERRIAETISKELNGVMLRDVCFLTGHYNEKLCVYYSMQIDGIYICPYGVFCIEVKNFSDECIVISGGADSMTWREKVNNHGKANNATNGCYQNRNHGRFLEQLFAHEGVLAPVFTLTVICGLPRNYVGVHEYMDDNLILEEELVDRIKYLRYRSKKQLDKIEVDVDRVNSIISKWKCIPSEERRRLHIYAVNGALKKKKGIPRRCKREKKCFVASKM